MLFGKKEGKSQPQYMGFLITVLGNTNSNQKDININKIHQAKNKITGPVA